MNPLFEFKETVATPGLVHVFFDLVKGDVSADGVGAAHSTAGASSSSTAGAAQPHSTSSSTTKLSFAENPNYLGRLIFRLFQERVPKTVENFRVLCCGKLGADYSYANSPFHRLIPGFMIQGGDFTKGNGTGGKSIYNNGGVFEDENLTAGSILSVSTATAGKISGKKTSTSSDPSGFADLQLNTSGSTHSKRGILSMANRGPNTNGSQFFLLFQPAPHLDGKHVVFGELVEGKDVLDRLERMPTDPSTDRPLGGIVIAKCGELVRVKRVFRPLTDDIDDVLREGDQVGSESGAGAVGGAAAALGSSSGSAVKKTKKKRKGTTDKKAVIKKLKKLQQAETM
eukprot:g10797.t1